MKKIALFMFLAVPVCADTGIVVLSTGVVIGKEIYTADTQSLNTYLDNRKLADPSLSFSLFDLSNATQTTTFNNTVVPISAKIMALVKSQANALIITGADATSELQRAVFLTILDQLNTIRASLPTPLAPITPAQAKTAVQNKINSGSAD